MYPCDEVCNLHFLFRPRTLLQLLAQQDATRRKILVKLTELR